MSKSGVPVVSQVADITAGGNVWDNIKSAVFQSNAQIPGTVDRWTKGAISRAGIPLISDTVGAANELYSDPYNTGKQGRYFQKQLRNTAVVASAVYGGPVIASSTGLASGASTALAGKIGYDLTQGNFAGALKTGLGTISPIETPFGNFSPNELVSKFTQSVGTLPRSPVENYQTPAQTLVYNPPSKISPIFIFAGIAGVTFLVIKLRKKA